MQKSSLIASTTFQPGTSFGTRELELSQAQIQTITDYTDLRLRVKAGGPGETCEAAKSIQSGVEYGPYFLSGVSPDQNHWFEVVHGGGDYKVTLTVEAGALTANLYSYPECEGAHDIEHVIVEGVQCVNGDIASGTVLLRLTGGPINYTVRFDPGTC